MTADPRQSVSLGEPILSAGNGPSRASRLPPELWSLAEEAREALSAERAAIAVRSCKLVALGHAVSASQLGGRALRECAVMAGLTRQTLHPYALIASRWPPEEIHDLLLQPLSADGRTITVSHLQLLARLPRAERDLLLGRVRREGLTVSQVKRALSSAKSR